MIILKTSEGIYGPFSSVETLEDRYICDGIEYQFSVIGDASIDDWVEQTPVTKEEVPESISRFQAIAQLYTDGLLDEVEAIMADPSTPTLAKIAWKEARDFYRQSPTILAITQALGLTPEAVDDMFIAAAAIKA